jgi:hypothetical protein
MTKKYYHSQERMGIDVGTVAYKIRQEIMAAFYAFGVYW